DDRLSFARMTEILYEVMRDAPQPPFTIGIFGEWGSGKSTLMRMLDDRLKRDKRKTVWFNAWKYDSKEVIWNALIQQIFYTMKTDPEVQQRSRAETFKSQVAHVAGEMAKYAAKVAVRF